MSQFTPDFSSGKKWALLLLVVFVVAFTRLLPHPPNFTPVLAIAIFCGALFPGRVWAYLVPAGAMIVSDYFIGFHDLSVIVYLSMMPAVFAGSLLSQTKPVGGERTFFGLKWLGIGVSADLLFFILSNLGVWWFSGFYARTWDGLLECYVVALPFLKNQLLGTATFLGLLLYTWYGLMVLAGWREPKLSYRKFK